MASDILGAADQPLDFSEEIALLRAVLVRAAPTAPPEAIVAMMGTLARLIAAQRKLPTKESRELADAYVALVNQLTREQLDDEEDDGYEDEGAVNAAAAQACPAPPARSMGSFLKKPVPNRASDLDFLRYEPPEVLDGVPRRGTGSSTLNLEP